jgi:hypothetical protein
MKIAILDNGIYYFSNTSYCCTNGFYTNNVVNALKIYDSMGARFV